MSRVAGSYLSRLGVRKPSTIRSASSFTLRGVEEMETEGTLSNAWDQHIASEFAAKSADQALATMTAEPHVNEVPLMIGARGRKELHDFYANHFLNQIPPTWRWIPSRGPSGRAGWSMN